MDTCILSLFSSCISSNDSSNILILKNRQIMRSVDTFAHMAAIVSLKCMDVCTPEWSTLGRIYLCSKTVKPSNHKFYIPAKYFAIPKWPVRYVGGLADNPNNRMCWTIEKEKMRIKKEKMYRMRDSNPRPLPCEGSVITSTPIRYLIIF